MADQQQGNALAALYPAPPAFLYQHFTSDNIERIHGLREVNQKASTEGSTQATLDSQDGVSQFETRINDLPSELQFLQPPEPPEDGKYRSFGDNYNLSEALPSLSEQGITQLYTPPSTPPPNSEPSTVTNFDRSLILKRIAKSLLLNFLELMGIMSINPEQYAEKVVDLRTLFINFHHLLNEYRPHQARESLILMMEEQVRKCKEEEEGIRKMRSKIEDVLKGLGLGSIDTGSNGTGAAVENPKGDTIITGDDIWRQLDEEIELD